MFHTIQKSFLFATIFSAVPALGSMLSGIDVEVLNFNAGDATYTTSNGLARDSSSNDRYFSSTNTAPGATSAGLTLSSVLGIPSGVVQSNAYASLEAGILRASVATPDAILVRGLGSAQIRDSVTFAVQGAPSAQIQVNAHLDGSLTGLSLPNSGAAITYNLGLSSAGFNYDINSFNQSTSFTYGTSPYYHLYNFDSYQFTNQSVNGFDFTGIYTVRDGETDPLYLSLSADCSDGASCDFANTARFSFTLPSNVTFTSDSGVLLTQVPSATPEPGTFLLGLPLIGLAACAWRKTGRSSGGARRNHRRQNDHQTTDR